MMTQNFPNLTLYTLPNNALSTSLSKFQPSFMSTTCWFSNVCMCKCVLCEDIHVVLWSPSSTCNFCSLCSIHLVCWEGLLLTWNSLIILACLYSELQRFSPFCHSTPGLKMGTVTFRQYFMDWIILPASYLLFGVIIYNQREHFVLYMYLHLWLPIYILLIQFLYTIR